MTTLRHTAVLVSRVFVLGGIFFGCASGESPNLGGNPLLLGDASIGGGGGSGNSGFVPNNPPVSTTGGGGGTGTGGSGAAPSQGSCNPDFCPGGGMGAPCCVSPNGPCGVDVGQGCVSTTATPDAGN